MQFTLEMFILFYTSFKTFLLRLMYNTIMITYIELLNIKIKNVNSFEIYSQAINCILTVLLCFSSSFSPELSFRSNQQIFIFLSINIVHLGDACLILHSSFKIFLLCLMYNTIIVTNHSIEKLRTYGIEIHSQAINLYPNYVALLFSWIIKFIIRQRISGPIFCRCTFEIKICNISSN